MGQIVKSNGSLTVKSLRRLAGVQGHRPSGKNACIASKMKNKSYTKPEPGMGGRNNKSLQKDFVISAKDCGFKLSDATKRKWSV